MTNQTESKPMAPEDATTSKKKFAPAKSFTCWLLALMLASVFVSGNINYLKNVPPEKISPALITKASVAFKLDQFNKIAGKTDVVVVGSSLPMCCLYYADDPKDAAVFQLMKEKNLNPLQAYTSALYFSKTTKSTVFNATVAASMISDVHLLVSKIIDKAPGKIILAVGLRDFTDNINCSFAGTPTFQALFDLPYAFNGDNLPFTFKHATGPIQQELSLNATLPMYRSHSEIGLAMTYESEKLFKKTGPKIAPKQESKPDANAAIVKLPTEIDASKIETASIEEKPVLDSLGYEKRYMPPNYKQMDLEAQALDRLCQLCNDKKVELILINMPVSSGHQALSSKEMRAKYLEILQSASTKYGIKYLNFEKNDLVPDKDYLDTVHMGPAGATKFLNYLVSESGIFTLSSKR
jgi:hypothetical protein